MSPQHGVNASLVSGSLDQGAGWCTEHRQHRERQRERWDRGTPSSVLGRGQPGPYSPDPVPWRAGEHETPGITSRKHLLAPCRWAQLTEIQALDRHPRPIFCTVIPKSPTCMTGVCGHFQISDGPQLPVARSTERCLKTSLRSPGAAFVFLKKGYYFPGLSILAKPPIVFRTGRAF